MVSTLVTNGIISCYNQTRRIIMASVGLLVVFDNQKHYDSIEAMSLLKTILAVYFVCLQTGKFPNTFRLLLTRDFFKVAVIINYVFRIKV